MKKPNSNKERVTITVLTAIVMVFICQTVSLGESAVAKGSTSKDDAVKILAVTETISAEGRAPIRPEAGENETRERAIASAKDEVILKVAARYVHPAILLREKTHLLNVFRVAPDEILQEVKILSEQKDGDSYLVRMTASVNKSILEDVLVKNLFHDRVIVIALEKNLGRPLKRHILEHDLISRVKKKGYAIVDYRTVNDATVRRLVSSIRQGKTEAVVKLGRYYLTDMIIVGFVETKFSQKTADIYSSYATGQVKVHKIGSRKELASLTKHEVKGFGSDEEKSGMDAIKKISPMMAEEALKGLPSRTARKVK
jgi:hypothetical protein